MTLRKLTTQESRTCRLEAIGGDLVEDAGAGGEIVHVGGQLRRGDYLTCNNHGCRQVVIPDADWRCPSCRSIMRFGTRHGHCPHCNGWAFFVRQGWKETCNCPCQLSPEQQARAAELEAEQRKREEQEALDKLERERQRELRKLEAETTKLQLEQTVAAKRCWAVEKQRKCAVKLEEPTRPYCRFCPKFGRTIPGQLREAQTERPTGYVPPIADVPMQEVE